MIEEKESIESTITRRNIVNDYRKIDTIVGSSYTSFIVYASYEDLDNGTLTVKQLKDNTKVISERSIKIPMSEFNKLIKEGSLH